MRYEYNGREQCIKLQNLQLLKSKPTIHIIKQNLQLILMHHGKQGQHQAAEGKYVELLSALEKRTQNKGAKQSHQHISVILKTK